MEEKSTVTHKTYSPSYFQVKSSLCHTQTFPVLIQALFKQLLYFWVPAKTQVIVEDLQGIFTFFSMESFWNEVHKPNNCGTGQTFANYRSGWWFFYYKFCNFCTWKLIDNLLFWTTFLLIVFSRSGWSGGQSCRNIRWSGWLDWSEWSSVQVVRGVRVVGVVRWCRWSGWSGWWASMICMVYMVWTINWERLKAQPLTYLITYMWK